MFSHRAACVCRQLFANLDKNLPAGAGELPPLNLSFVKQHRGGAREAAPSGADEEGGGGGGTQMEAVGEDGEPLDPDLAAERAEKDALSEAARMALAEGTASPATMRKNRNPKNALSSWGASSTGSGTGSGTGVISAQASIGDGKGSMGSIGEGSGGKGRKKGGGNVSAFSSAKSVGSSERSPRSGRSPRAQASGGGG